jgi:hypothetical protein
MVATAVGGTLAAPRPAHAVVGGLAKLAKLAAKAGKVGKLGKLGGAAKLIGAGGVVVATERAGLLFRFLPDDAARAATYVAREGDSLRMVRRAGGDLDQRLVPSGAAPDLAEASVYLDVSAALDPPRGILKGADVHVLDRAGKPHPVRTANDGNLVVDVAEQAMDLGQFALEQVAEGEGEREDDRDLVVLPAAGEACVPGDDALEDGDIPRSYEDHDAAAATEYITETRGLWMLVFASSAGDADRLHQASAAHGHDLTTVVVQDCDAAAASAVATTVEADGLRGVAAPLMSGPTLRLDAAASTTPLRVGGVFSEHPLGVTAIQWTIDFNPPEPKQRDGDTSLAVLIISRLLALAILGWLGWQVFRGGRWVVRLFTGNPDAEA